MARDDDTVTGPPVELLSRLEPWDHPQRINPGPHNLPPPGQRPALKPFVPLLPGPGMLPGPALPPGPAAKVIDGADYPLLAGESVRAVGLAAIVVVPSPTALRNMLGFRNSGATNITIAFGTQATANSWLFLTPNQMLLFDTRVPQDEVWALSDAAGGQLTCVSSNYTPP